MYFGFYCRVPMQAWANPVLQCTVKPSGVLTTTNWITRLLHSVELIWILSNFSTFPTFQCAAVTHQIEPQHSSRASNKFEFLHICCAALLQGSKTNGDQLIFQRTGMTKDILLFNLVMVRLGYFDSSHSPQNIGHGFDDVLAWPALSMIWPVAIGRFVWWPSQIHLKSSDHQSHLIRECKAGIHCKAIGSTHRGGGSSRESEGRSMQTDRRLQTGACTWQTAACTRQTRMQTSRQQLVQGRQADRYRASPVNMIAMLCPWHCSMNHWFLPLLNLSSKPYNFYIKSICWSCNYTSPLGVTLDTGNYIWVMRRTILMIRVGQTQRLSGVIWKQGWKEG